MTEIQIADERFAETEEDMRGGVLHVTNWPKVRVSNPNFLDEMIVDMDRSLAARKRPQRQVKGTSDGGET